MKQADEHDIFEISMAVGNKVLGQHAGELLLEVGNSAFRNVALGIICMRTMVGILMIDFQIFSICISYIPVDIK